MSFVLGKKKMGTVKFPSTGKLINAMQYMQIIKFRASPKYK